MVTTVSRRSHRGTPRVRGISVPPRVLSPLAAGVLAAAALLSACSPEPTAITPELERGGSAVPLSVTPSTLLLRMPGLSETFTATVQYSGGLTASSSNPGCATVNPTTTTSTEKPAGSSVYVAQFTVTGVGMHGCTITVTDKKGNVASVRVSVSPIAFQSDRDDPDGVLDAIYLMDADGQNQTRLDEGIQPALSPDCTKIAFVSGRDGDPEIYVIGVDGQNLTQLTHNGVSDSWPDWSPDGSKIVFASDRDGPSHVYVMDSDGQNAIPLTNSALGDYEPAWSPNGTQIAFVSQRDRDVVGVGGEEIFVMQANGENPTRLTDDDLNVLPTWSPNGAKIAFQSFRDNAVAIWLMDVDGQNQTRLTYNTGIASSVEPAWSPDGTRIAFAARDGELHESFNIYVVGTDGQHQTALTTSGPFDRNEFPDWP